MAVLPTGMTAPEARTAVETEEILSTWLEHGYLRGCLPPSGIEARETDMTNIDNIAHGW
jgi:hypothetical protein